MIAATTPDEMGDEMGDEPNAYRIDTGEPVYDDGDDVPGSYKTPFERAQSRFEQANETVVQLGTARALDPISAAKMQYQAAQFEMLTAIHEVVERIERGVQGAAGDRSAESLLERVAGAATSRAEGDQRDA